MGFFKNYKHLQTQNLILFGHAAAGKTFFGKQLAQNEGLLFIDTDRAVEAFYKSSFNENLSCRQIYLHLEESGFRKIEKKVVADLQTVRGAVIALGGGTLLEAANFVLLQKIGQLVYLKSDHETLKKRIFLRDPLPAFLEGADSEKAFERIYNERQACYEQLKSLTIQTEGKTEPQILTELTKLSRIVFNVRGLKPGINEF